VNILVTGGLQGIGKGIVKALQTRGDKTFIFDYVGENDSRVRDLVSSGSKYFQVDVSDTQSIKNGFEQLYAIIGTEPLDALVNNAGVARDNLVLRMSEQEWDQVLDVNLKGTFFCSQQAIKRMIKQQKSYIINLSSIVAFSGNPGQANYAASKAGIVALTKTLAQEYASRNVIVNAIAPGFIQTQMTEKLSDNVKNYALERIPLKRFGQVEDIANLVLFLTSGHADYVTGQVIGVNGGMI
jgi:3-oxoacyl-[acyl-carrier protein] reductase